MRKQALQIVFTVSLFGLLCAGARAQTANNVMKFHVPFEFVVGERTMPAGDYLVSFVSPQSSPTALLIKSGDGRASRIIQMTPVEARRARRAATLVFNRYGTQHFLSQFWTPAERAGLKVRRSRSERTVEVARSGERATVEIGAGK